MVMTLVLALDTLASASASAECSLLCFSIYHSCGMRKKFNLCVFVVVDDVVEVSWKGEKHLV